MVTSCSLDLIPRLLCAFSQKRRNTMFVSRQSLQQLEMRILSPRFRAGTSSFRKKISDLQLSAIERLSQLAHTGGIWFSHEPCPCGLSKQDTVIATRDRYGLPITSVICDYCGAIRIDPYFDYASLSCFYTTIYQDLYGRSLIPAEYFQRQKSYGKKILDNFAIDHQRRGNHILEIGAGSGGALHVFQEEGNEVSGCDYSRELIEFGRVQGVENLVVGSLSEWKTAFPENEVYDLVYMHHVFEHIGDPVSTIEDVVKLLKPDGELLIIVPDIYRIHAHRKSPDDCMEFIHVAHKWNFTRECFAALAKKSGLFAAERTPTGNRTAWSDAPELWISMRKQPGVSSLNVPREGIGEKSLNYLLEEEAIFGQRCSEKVTSIAG